MEGNGATSLENYRLTPFRAQKKDQPEGWPVKVEEVETSRGRPGVDPNDR